MKLTNSLLEDLVTEYANLRPQIYFKSSLTALARAMQDLVLTDNEPYLVIANFQQEKFFRQQAHRFQRMALKSDHVYILGVPDTESSFAVANSGYKTIPIESTDTLAGERYLVIIGQQYSACLAVREKLSVTELKDPTFVAKPEQRFEGIWSFNREITYTAADWLLGRITNYCPELREKTQRARKIFIIKHQLNSRSLLTTQSIDLNIFTQRLVTYLQAGQYKLLKAYNAIATAERKESLINKIASAQRSSLNPEEILSTTVRELGQLFPNCRCLLYSFNSEDTEVEIEYEYKPAFMNSLIGQQWSIAENPLFIAVQAQRSTLIIDDVTENFYLNENPSIQDKIARAGIHSWLMVAIRYQGQLLGMLELHYGESGRFQWQSEDVAVIEAVAISAGAALTQASAYTNLIQLNAQLEAVEQIQSNLIAIVGHELRTPLSTIRICLESLATEPDMPPEFKNMMVDTALGDTERLGQLVQNFLTLSKLEAGKAYRNIRNIESLTIDYALNLALRNIQTTSQMRNLPEIRVELPAQSPSVLADVDGLVEVFTKLLDNACKFTPAEGEIIVTAQIQKIEEITVAQNSRQMLEIIITDTGRGINESELEIIFDRFSQAESYLRRTVNGVGLGLVICRKIIQGMGGEIWAKSGGKNQGSQFHFTLPIESQSLTDII
jgi:signal transduction histidine kinase/DICT domain-containing protein